MLKQTVKVLVLFIFASVNGQTLIPDNISVQCFDSSPTCDSASLNAARTDLFMGAEDEINHCCLSFDEAIGTVARSDQSSTYYRLGTGECRSCLHESVGNTFSVDCFLNQPAGACTALAGRDDTETNDAVNICCAFSPIMTNFRRRGDPSAPCIACYDIGSSPAMGNDPHFFLPLSNGDNMCFSIQGEPDFPFSLINDKYIQLHGQFVQPVEGESHTISNVTTFIGGLGMLVTSPKTSDSLAIKVSAIDHSILIGSSFTIVKNKPVTVNVSSTVLIHVDANVQATTLKDESAWLYINTDVGFGMKVKFYKKHLHLFLTNTSGLTKAAHGLIGQFLTADVKIESDVDYTVMKLGDRKPVLLKRGDPWPFLGVSGKCWYAASGDNQATGIIDGVYTDYIVKHLIPLEN